MGAREVQASRMNGAIVGAGASGLLHALSLRAHGVPVTLVFDPDAPRARTLAEMCGAHAVDDLAELADSAADCVCVCSPPRWHVVQATRCARPGRIVFVEKPVAVSRDELAGLARAPGCVPIVQWRAGRSIRALRSAIAEGLLGPAPTVNLDLALHRADEYFAAGRGTRASWGCGALLSVGIHALDAMCFALNRTPLDVRALLGPGELERTACVLVSFEGGAAAVVRVAFDGGGPDEVRMTFCGGGVTATIAGTEVDPTAGAVRWTASDSVRRARLEALEAATGGQTAAPLLVPYIGEALAAVRRGLGPGGCDALPSIGDVAGAHEIALRAMAERPAGP
jgi:predicted dehydrogenase